MKEKDILKNLGENLKKARIKRQLTQQEAADRSLVSRKTIVSIEKGQPTSTLNIARLASAYMIEQNLAELFSDEQDTIGRSLAFGSLSERVKHSRSNKNPIEDEFQ